MSKLVVMLIATLIFTTFIQSQNKVIEANPEQKNIDNALSKKTQLPKNNFHMQKNKQQALNNLSNEIITFDNNISNLQTNIKESTIITPTTQNDTSSQKMAHKKINKNNYLNLISNSQAVQTYLTLIINDNKNKIKNHNSNPKNTYKMTQNKFIIYTQQQFAQTFLNLRIPLDQLNQTNSVSVSQSRLLSTISIDWKSQMKMTSVKYQGSCGACYAFSSISAIQSAYILKGQFVNLSEQELIDCSTNYGNDGCDGGWIGNAYNYILKNQILPESAYPYENILKNCSLPTNKAKFKIASFKTIPNSCSQVTLALLNQPLTIAVNANGWQYYSSGVFSDCQAGTVNHGVVLVGVDSESWKIKNSWGYAWGQLGYIRVGLNAANQACQVCKYGSYPIL